MIAKTTTGSSFDSALGYGAADLTENQRQHKQAQVVLLDCYNLISSEWRGMAAEMSAVAQGSRCQTPVWHTSLSVGADESLSGEQWRAAARQYCVSMGADPQQHQVVIFQHQDTAHPHVHIYINRVRLDDGPALHTGHNYARNVKATRHIEQSLVLAPLPDQRTSLKDHSLAIQANRQQLATLVGQVMSQTKPSTFDELTADLAGLGVQLQVITNAKGGYGTSFKAGDNPPAKGSAIGYKYRHLQQQLDANRAEYQAEIERLKHDLEQKPAPVTIIRPSAEQQAEIQDLTEQRTEAYEKRDQMRDAYLNKPAITILTEVEVEKEVIKPDPADQIQIKELTRQLTILQDVYDQQQTNVDKIGVTVTEVVETNQTLQEENQRLQRSLEQQQRLNEKDRKAIIETYNDLAARFNALQKKLQTRNAGASTEQTPAISAPAVVASPAPVNTATPSSVAAAVPQPETKATTETPRPAASVKLTLDEQYVTLFGYPPHEDTRIKLEAGKVMNNIRAGKTIWVKDGVLNFRPYTPAPAPTVANDDAKPANEKPAVPQTNAPGASKSASADPKTVGTSSLGASTGNPVGKPSQAAPQADSAPKSAPAWHEDLRQKLSKTKNTASLQYNGYQVGRNRLGEEQFRPHSSRDSSDWITAKELGVTTLQNSRKVGR